MSIDYGLTVYELNLHMHNPKYVEDAAAVYEMTHKVTMDTIRGKANNVPMIEVVNSIEEDSDTFMVLASACIGNYYISYQN